MHFSSRLIAAIREKNSVVCVGLDPQLSKLPRFLVERAMNVHGETRKAAAQAFLDFNKGIMDATAEVAVAVKPQLAFYEELGADGIWAFEETCKYAQTKGLLVIADGKRNDIGSTAEAYARAFFAPELFGKVQETGVDALTVNPYLGLDGIRPFLKYCEQGKGLFVLVRTSNPSSGDLQDRVTADEQISVAELMGHFVESWGDDTMGEEGYSDVGAVVGATFPKQATRLRELMPKQFFLVPGYGAQGGTVQDIAPCFNADGFGALINNSRGLLYAFSEKGAGTGENYMDTAREAALAMRDAINGVRA